MRPDPVRMGCAERVVKPEHLNLPKFLLHAVSAIIIWKDDQLKRKNGNPAVDPRLGSSIFENEMMDLQHYKDIYLSK